MILRPEYTIDSLEKDIDVLKQTYDMGYRVTKENINRIKELFLDDSLCLFHWTEEARIRYTLLD